MTRLLFLFPAIVLLLISCDSDPQMSENHSPPPPQVNFSEERLVEFAETMEVDFTTGDGEYFSGMFDPVAFFKRVVWPRDPKKKEIDDFVQGFMEGTEGTRSGFGGRIARQFQAAGGVKFLRVVRDTQGVRLLYRVIGKDYAVSYFELLIGESAAGEPAIVDMYMASTGENLSRTVAGMNPGAGKSLGSRLLGKENNVKQTTEAFSEMSKLLAAERYEDVLTYFDNLPTQLQRQKAIQFARIRAGMSTNDNKRSSAIIGDFFELYPNEPGVDLLQIEYYFIRKEYDSALAAIDRLDSRFQDPYLNFQRAGVYLARGEFERASEYAEALIRRDSTLIEPYLILVKVGLEEKDHSATAATLERVQRSGAGTITFATIETDTAYAYFRNSEEYKQLKRKYR